MSSFAHLHLHTQYSLLDGANRLDDVLQAAKDAEMPAVAITDHGNLFGAIDFYQRARDIGIKPILGIEAYVAKGSHTERDRSKGRNNHLVLLARNETGYKNLIKLTSRSYLEGFYYKPRIDKDLLRSHSEGLIGLSACLQGEVIEKVLGGREDEAEATAREFEEILGSGNYYLELQDHGIEDQRSANDVLRRISRRTGIPLVATNDCHYLAQDDSFAHDVLLCIGTQRTLSDTDRLKYASDQFYLKTADEMHRLFPQDGEAVENTVAIAERCNLEIPTGTFHLPEFPVPEGETLESYFERTVRDGLEERLRELGRRRAGVLEQFSAELYKERLETEIGIIKTMGFPGYFMTVWDFIRFARDQQIPVGPGRGSAAGSLVAYALRITDIDPLQYGLLFERFLNPERVSLPDIDIDFCMRRRGEVIQYVSDKFGRDHVAQIITFGTLAAKAVIRDVGRVMGVPYSKIDRIAKLVPDMTRSLSQAVKEVDALKSEAENDHEVGEIVRVGERLEGLTRHASLHAAGVVITPCPTEDLVPLAKTSKDEVVTQWDMNVIEKLGLLKMDFLGLRTLTVIDDTQRSLAHLGVALDLDEIPLDDPETFRLFCDGQTDGIFQFESRGMKDLLRRAQPSQFEDLVAFNALYRPGALSVGMVDEYILRKKGRRKVRYVLKETEPILAETYGVIAYQEQVMQIAVEIGGFTMGEADILRKAMGKKKPEVMQQQKQKFVDGAVTRGFAKRKAEEVWEYIEPFAGYGFNKSHSVAYAMLAYKTAFLKAHYPVAFMAAMLSSEMSSKDNVAKYIRECRAMGIPVLPPDVNESNWTFTVAGESIRFGLGAIKGVGSSAVEAILETRRSCARFSSFVEFAREVDHRAVNHKVFECMVKAGCFDGLGAHRRALSESLDTLLDFAQTRRRDAEEGQGALFSAEALPEPEPDTSLSPWSDADRLRYEKEALSFYLTGNPLDEYREELSRLTTHTSPAALDGVEGPITLGGLVSSVRRTKIKNGRNAGRYMGRFTLEDLEGRIPVAVFADNMARFDHLLQEETVVLVKGIVRDRGSEPEMTAEEIVLLEDADRRPLEALDLILETVLPDTAMMALRDCLVEHHGDVPVRLRLDLEEHSFEITPEDRFRVAVDDDLVTSLEAIVGEGRVRKRFHEAPLN
ncbi:MAG: DNA polymerase III subunit alpha [Acidobacteriota bacterium]|nr:DNA polymerase III subunit alpha [Acidobacteriota bacterium]